jgi:flavin reductase (DIM6/NTAB) family NADH-FMN oxidoreductase RutF
MNTLDLLSDAAVAKRGLRNALGRFATGVTVVTTRTRDGTFEGVTANSFSAVSLEPPLVLWSLRCEARSLPAFLASNCFAINVLSKEQARISRHFATPQLNKFEGMDFKLGIDCCPIFERSPAIFECHTQTKVQGGDHIILIGRVVRVHHCDATPPPRLRERSIRYAYFAHRSRMIAIASGAA